MIASNEGAGNGHDGGEADWQHAQNMRDDLLDYGRKNEPLYQCHLMDSLFSQFSFYLCIQFHL